MKTHTPRKEELVQKSWHLIDAKGKVLGRLASDVANILRGKNKPIFTPRLDTGDFVVVINAREVRLTGKKWDQKRYYWHSGSPGGIKSYTAEELREKKPEELIRLAVRGMLPKNRLGRKVLKKLKVYASEEHPHEAQTPVPLS